MKKSQLAEDSLTLIHICPPRFLIPGLYICLFSLLSAQFALGGTVEAVILFPLPNKCILLSTQLEQPLTSS